MSEHDALKLAARALRQSSDGKRTDSGLTRARVMNSVHGQRRRQAHWWMVTVPTIAVFLGGSAWAQATNSWSVVWQQVTSVLGVESTKTEPGDNLQRSTNPTRLGNKPPAPQQVPPVEPQPAALEAPLEDPVEVQPALRAPPALERSSETPVLPARPAGETTPPSESAEPDPDPELSAFRSAHRLHFEGRAPEAAIDAYERYIAQYPRGRYVPEARYNVGINLLRLGRTQAAREALEPFAVGRYGGYRQQEARSLIDAL